MTRGRPSRSKLSRASIIAAALDLAEQNRQPTLGAVARALNVHVTSLYNHVEDLADLVNALREAVSNQHTNEDLADSWEGIFRQLSADMHEVFTTYPGLVVPFATTPIRASGIGSLFELLTEKIETDIGSRTVAEAGVRALNSLIIGIALDSLDPDTSTSASDSSLELGVESLILFLSSRSH